MDEKTKKVLEDAGVDKEVVDALEAAATELTEEKKGREEDKETHEKAIAEKDVIIKKKTEDVVGARKEFKLLKDMTEEEKKDMSEKEIELQQRQEDQDERQKKQDEDQKERDDKLRDAEIDKAILKKVGDHANLEELRGKVKENLKRLDPESTSITGDEIEKIVTEGFDMLGEPAREEVGNAISESGGGAPGEGGPDDFGESKAGKDLAKEMGLLTEAPKEDGGGEGGGTT